MAIASEAMIDMAKTMIRIWCDFVLVLTDTHNAQKYIMDILKAILKLLEDFEHLLMRLLMNFPGVKQICTTIVKPIAQFINMIVHMLCDAIQSVHSMFNTVSGTIAGVIKTIMGYIQDIANGFADFINGADEFFGGDGDIIDPPKLTDISKVITDAVNSAFATLEGDTCHWKMSEDLCDMIGGGNGTEDFEPTVCTVDADCSPENHPSPLCWVDAATTSCSWSNFARYPGLQKQHSEWAQPCNCNDLAEGHEPFCNVATGFCQVPIQSFIVVLFTEQEGITPLMRFFLLCRRARRSSSRRSRRARPRGPSR